MAESPKTSTLVISRQSPYANTRARTALDTVLAFAAFDQEVNLLLLDAAVLQALGGQDGHCVGRKDHGKMLASLPLYGVETIYADDNARRRYQLESRDDWMIEVQWLNSTAIADLIASHHHVVSV